MLNESQKTALCHGYMSGIVRNLTGLQNDKIDAVVRTLHDAGEHDHTIRALAVTLRAVIDLGREATETPRDAKLFGNPADLEWDGD